jgi:hypothetical protein
MGWASHFIEKLRGGETVSFRPRGASMRGAARLEGLYGVALAGDDLLLLMRHRAVLLGLVGAALQRVFWIDVIACVLLLGGYLISRRRAHP